MADMVDVQNLNGPNFGRKQHRNAFKVSFATKLGTPIRLVMVLEPLEVNIMC